MKMDKVFCMLIVLIGFLGCEDETGFYPAVSNFKLSADIVYVDSVVQFVNCSDSVNVTYKWDFGDGATSTERSPKHSYKDYGHYTVMLSTYVNDIKSDSSSVIIKVIIGEKYVDLLKMIQGIDFAECKDSSIIVLGATWENEDVKFFISKFDKNLRKKWLRYLDSEFKPSMNSIESLSDGNFIIAGSFDSGSDSYMALTKIDSTGNIIWAKKYQQTDGYCNYATESKDGGIIAIGAEDYLDDNSSLVSVLKTDANGNLEWKKHFVDESLRDAENIISVDDGYIFASSNYLQNYLVIMKIGLDSNTIWKTAKKWQIQDSHTVYNVWFSSLALNSKNIVAVNSGNGFVMVFDLQGNFIERNYSDVARNRFISTTSNDNFIVGGGDIFWELIKLNGFNTEGEKNWSKVYGKREKRYSPSKGFGSSLKPILDGNLLFLGVSYKRDSGHDESSMLLLKIDEAGEIQ